MPHVHDQRSAAARDRSVDRDLISAGGPFERLEVWFETELAVPGPFEVHLIACGRSNLTFEVCDDAGTRVALRRPPHGELLSTAHDVGREHRLLAALARRRCPFPSRSPYAKTER